MERDQPIPIQYNKHFQRPELAPVLQATKQTPVIVLTLETECEDNPFGYMTSTTRLCFPRNKTVKAVVMKREFLKNKKYLEFYCFKSNRGLIIRK